MHLYVEGVGMGKVIGYEDYSGARDCIEVTERPDHDEWRYIVRFYDKDINLYIFQEQGKEFD